MTTFPMTARTSKKSAFLARGRQQVAAAVVADARALLSLTSYGSYNNSGGGDPLAGERTTSGESRGRGNREGRPKDLINIRRRLLGYIYIYTQTHRNANAKCKRKGVEMQRADPDSIRCADLDIAGFDRRARDPCLSQLRSPR